MPFFKIETNQTYSDPETLLAKASTFISEMLGKPEKYVMISIDGNKPMMFGGNAEPTAFVQLKSIGLPADKCKEFSSMICQFVNNEFHIPENRIFIDFKDLHRNMFGWNGTTF